MEIRVPNAQRCVEDVVFAIVCTCNLKTLVVARNGVVRLPPKYAGRPLEEARKECGICLEITDGEEQYLLVFLTLKLGLQNLAEIIASRCKSL